MRLLEALVALWGVLILLFMASLVITVSQIVEVVQKHELDQQAEAVLETDEYSLEFGTLPPNCEGLSALDWQNCMHVGPK
jgi:hypothetical protein